MSYQRLCRICLATEDGSGEHLPIFEDDQGIAHKIYLCSGVQVYIAMKY